MDEVVERSFSDRSERYLGEDIDRWEHEGSFIMVR